MRIHVVRISDNLVVNTIVADELPISDTGFRYVPCNGSPAPIGLQILPDGSVVAPIVEPAEETVEHLAEQLADLQARLEALGVSG